MTSSLILSIQDLFGLFILTSSAHSDAGQFWSSEPLTNNMGQFILPTLQRQTNNFVAEFLIITTATIPQCITSSVTAGQWLLTSTLFEGLLITAWPISLHVWCSFSSTRIMLLCLPSKVTLTLQLCAEYLCYWQNRTPTCWTVLGCCWSSCQGRACGCRWYTQYKQAAT